MIAVFRVSVWQHRWTVETWHHCRRRRHRRRWNVWWVWVDCHDAGTTSTELLILRLSMSMTRPWWHHGQLHYLQSTASLFLHHFDMRFCCLCLHWYHSAVDVWKTSLKNLEISWNLTAVGEMSENSTFVLDWSCTVLMWFLCFMILVVVLHLYFLLLCSTFYCSRIALILTSHFSFIIIYIFIFIVKSVVTCYSYYIVAK